MQRLFLFVLIAMLGSFSVAAQDSSGENYFVEAVVDNPTPFVGQQITYIFRLYDAGGFDNPLYEPSDFEGFWRIDLGGVSQHVEQLNGRQYTVSEIKTALYPTRTGTISIASAGVMLPDTVFQSKRELKANAVQVQVQPLPEGAPEDFSGGVGRFEMGASLDHQSVQLGEPVTLRLTVSGTGNVEQLPLPSAPFPSTWRVYENPATYSATQQNGQVIGSKVYELVVLPDQVGLQTLPSVTLSYFDPTSLAYRSVNSAPVQIEVVSNDNVLTPTLEANQSTSSVLGLKPISAHLKESGDFPGLIWGLLWLMPFAAVAAGWVWRSYQRYLLLNHAVIRQSQALKFAHSRLDKARKMSSNKAYTQIKEAIVGYISDKLGVSSVGDLNHDWQADMEARGLPAHISQQLSFSIDLVNQGLYAPYSDIQIKSVVDRVTKLLADIDRSWKIS